MYAIKRERTQAVLKISRLLDMLEYEKWEWNENQPVYLGDISDAVKRKQKEIRPGGNPNKKINNPKDMPNEWHIGRIIYYINHPDKIRNIKLNNLKYDNKITPQVVVVDGSHRWMAACWLYDKGLLKEILCDYNGRDDVLDYLKGIRSDPPLNPVFCLVNEN